MQRAKDPTSPLVLDTHELGRRPGAMMRLQRTIPAPADLGTTVIGIPAGAEMNLDLRLESVMEGVLVSGEVTATAVGECSRCLDVVREDLTVPIQELFAYPERISAAEMDAEEEEATVELDGDLADIEDTLRDAVVTALPFSPLCQPDCMGLCSECGARLADDPGHAHELTDPRWSALQSMFDTPNVSDNPKES